MDGLFITGTDTEIGKTLITSILAYGLRKRGIKACPVKPIASGGVNEKGILVSEDARFYRRFCGLDESASTLNPCCFRHPASPHLAADMEGKTIDSQAVINSLHSLAHQYEYLLIEGIGGWMVPIAECYTVADFAWDLDLPVLIVSANRLGTINHTLLTIESMRIRDIDPMGVIMTHPSPIQDRQIAEDNINTIRQFGEVEILGNVPYLGKNIERNETADTLWPRIEETIQWQRILQILHIL